MRQRIKSKKSGNNGRNSNSTVIFAIPAPRGAKIGVSSRFFGPRVIFWRRKSLLFENSRKTKQEDVKWGRTFEKLAVSRLWPGSTNSSPDFRPIFLPVACKCPPYLATITFFNFECKIPWIVEEIRIFVHYKVARLVIPLGDFAHSLPKKVSSPKNSVRLF